MVFLTQLFAWINIPANSLGKLFFPPIGTLPGWLSNTIISAVVGIVLLLVFKYTSNQIAIGRIRDNIKANMLALKLFKDSLAVTMQTQGRIFKGALFLLIHAIRPMAVIIVPVVLLLGQMGLWYQHQPLNPGKEAIVTMAFNCDLGPPLSDVAIETAPAAELLAGPVRVLSKREIYWKIKGCENGYNYLIFHIDDQEIEKELAVGDGFMRVSAKRPGWHWTEILSNPWEKPFAPDSIVSSISIEYPERASYTSGTNWWIFYFFIVSLVFALIFKPVFKVRI